ncbi:hypothetical protein E4U03_07805 [Rothia nasimurium]|uniref:Phage major tail protein, TP901-1 family n=1 Tax=Rothia nasimurium TaxID=85336 RepID=A0A4Y9F464_9MICC|nr:hypothetical protein [Rothia nasimurium]MBF0808512.1 hypothetical protein [Rothia nasimurium]TFU21906.1 hypothetical protein E4U03_07805 [Rothia nasimurium]
MAKDDIQVVEVGTGTLVIGKATTAHVMSHQVTSVKLVPKTATSDGITVLSGKQKGGSRKETWTLEGEFLFDAGAKESTSDFLFENRGKDLEFEFVPSTANKNKYTGVLTVESAEIGGDVAEENLKVDFEFPLVGVPTKSKLA